MRLGRTTAKCSFMHSFLCVVPEANSAPMQAKFRAFREASVIDGVSPYHQSVVVLQQLFITTAKTSRCLRNQKMVYQSPQAIRTRKSAVSLQKALRRY